MKRIKETKVRTLTGEKYPLVIREGGRLVPVKDPVSGEVYPKTRLSESLIDVLEFFVLNGLPREGFTNLDGVKIGNVYRALQNARKTGVIELDDDDHRWLANKLEDDKAGAFAFSFNAPIIIEAVENFERLHHSKDKTDDR